MLESWLAGSRSQRFRRHGRGRIVWWGPRGFQVQTWQDIERARQDIERLIAKEYHYGNADATAPKLVSHKPVSQKRIPPR